MKRLAMLIGNTGGLPGVNVDIRSFQNFLKSNAGGAWYNEEIEMLKNVNKLSLLNRLIEIKRSSLDYLIILFSGHGGTKRDKTILELSENEQIEETVLRNIAGRQLNLYDCCRTSSENQNEAVMKSFNYSTIADSSGARRQYERRIMQSIRQQVLLFSCSVGQISYDTQDGGVYLQSFLRAARSIGDGKTEKLVGAAHEEAAYATLEKSRKMLQGLQTPEALLPKCLSEQQLVISITA